MTVLPPSPFLESVGIPSAAGPAAPVAAQPSVAGPPVSENAAPECHGSLPSGESDPSVTADCAGAAASSCGGPRPTAPLPMFGQTADHPSSSVASGQGVHPTDPHDQVLVDRALLEQLMAELQELALLRSWRADYERLLEKERIELLTPPPIFLRRSA